MSNTTNNKDVNIFRFLSSKEFITELNEKNFPPDEHNLLLSAHLLAIGFNTSGINEGNMNVSYSRINDEKFFRAKSNFAFYTTRNGLIEESSYFSRQSITFNHPMFRFRDTRGFRDFCIEYFDKYSKIIDLDHPMTTITERNNKIHFRLNGKLRKSDEGQIYGFQSIVCSNPNVRNLLDAFMLEKELNINTEDKKKKFKL